MSKKWCVIIIMLLGCAFLSNTDAQLLRVGYIEKQPPYTTQHKDHPGIAIELWDLVARQNNWQYQLIPEGGNIEAALNDLAAGKIDVLLGGIPISNERMKKADFSQPYFISAVGLITKQSKTSMLRTLKEMLVKIFNIKIFIIITVAVILIHMLWAVEKGHQLPKNYWRGIRKSVWLNILTILTGYMQYNVRSHKTKVITIFMLLFSLFILSALSGLMSSAFVLSFRQQQQITNVNDIGQQAVAAVAGTTNVNVAENYGLSVYQVANVEAGIDLIKANKVIGMIINIPTAKAYLAMFPEKDLLIAPLVFKQDEMNIAFAKQSNLVTKFNSDLVQLQNNSQMEKICARYLAAEETRFCGI